MFVSRLKNTKRFSAIETIMVIVIAGFLVAVFIPRLSTAPISLATAVNTIQADLRFAQERAMSRNPIPGAPVGITFGVGPGVYTITDPAGAVTTVRGLPSEVTITAGGTIAFNKYGEPETIATISVQAGGVTRNITVEAFSGRSIAGSQPCGGQLQSGVVV
jgi:type II secretory pathway pseudopilin PulG